MTESVRIVCISDTHCKHSDMQLPGGDVLVHAGDSTRRGTEAELAEFNAFLARQPHAHKLIVAGNHDFLFQTGPARARELLTAAVYLEDDGIELLGLSFWGSPWQPWFHDWAFNLERGAALAERWAQVPAGVDVLITHGPPAGILDRTLHGLEVGCADLTEALDRIRPRLHVFGHIHESAGVRDQDGTLFVNASSCDRWNRLAHPPVVIDWTPAGPRPVGSQGQEDRP